MKKSYRRILAMLLTLVMLCSLIPAAFADDAEAESAPAEAPVAVETTAAPAATPAQATATTPAAVPSTAPAAAPEQSTTVPAVVTPTTETTTSAVKPAAEETASVTEPAAVEDISVTEPAAVENVSDAEPATDETLPVEAPATEETAPVDETVADENAPATEPAEESATETTEEETLSEEVANTDAAAADQATCEHSYSVSKPGVCELCGEAHTEHTYGKYSKDMVAYRVSAADCEHAAVYYKRCTVCYASAKRSTIKEKTFTYGDPLGHTLVAVEAKEPTCADGNMTYWVCERCGKLFLDEQGTEETTAEAVVIPAVIGQHGPMTAVAKKDATATEDGNIAYYICDTCGELFLDETGNMQITEAQTRIHSITTHTEAKDATCTEDGNVEYWTCGACGKLFADEGATTEISQAAAVVKAHHSLVKTEAIAETCTEDGNIEYWYCSACDKYFSDKDAANEITKAETIDHLIVPYKYIAPTKTTHGNIECYYCQNCLTFFLDEEATIEIPFEDCILHNLKKTKAKAATCTEEGNNEYYTCTVCKDVFKDAYGITPTTKAKEKIEALGHAWSEWERKDDDQHALYCVRCWESHIAAHAYETVTINGVEHSICSVCGCTKNTEDQAFTWINYYASAYAKEGTVPYARFAVRMRDNPFKDDTTIVRAFTAVFEKDGSVLKMDKGSIARFTVPMYLDYNTQNNFTLYRVDKDENGQDVLTAIEATYFADGYLQFETESTGLFLIQAN